MAYLIDTDWAVDYLKGIEDKVGQLQDMKNLFISALSVGELVEGIEDSGREDRCSGRLSLRSNCFEL